MRLGDYGDEADEVWNPNFPIFLNFLFLRLGLPIWDPFSET